VNLALVGKAVTVSEVIARGDSGLLPKIKSVMGNLKLDEVSEQVARHVETIGREVERSVREKKDELAKKKDEVAQAHDNWWNWKRTPEERRARLLEKGFSSFFSGVGMMIFLYVLGHYIQWRIPEEVYANAPLDLDAAIHLAWIVGVLPMLAGIGQLIAAISIRLTTPRPAPVIEQKPLTTPLLDATTAEEFNEPPPSVTEHTTAQLDYEAIPRADHRSRA
jgi:hypothetical protein